MRLDECFVVAKIKAIVVGFLYCQYYFESQLLFISSLGTDADGVKNSDVVYRVARELMMYMFKRVERLGCIGVVAEVKKEGAQARHFCNLASGLRAGGKHLKLGRLDIEYRQPRISLWDGVSRQTDYEEADMLLLYGEIVPDSQFAEIPLALGDKVPIAQVRFVLDFVYKKIYGDCFE